MKFALCRLPILAVFFTKFGIAIAADGIEGIREDVTISSGIVGPDGNVILFDDSPTEEVARASDLNGAHFAEVKIVTNVTMSSDDDIDPNLELWVRKKSGGEKKKAKYNRRLKGKSKRKLKLSIMAFSSGTKYCKRNQHISYSEGVKYPQEINTHKCNCSTLFPNWCDPCCPNGYINNGDKCIASPYDSYCRDGLKKRSIGCNKCDDLPNLGPPGMVPMSLKEDEKEVCGEGNEKVCVKENEDDFSIQIINDGCKINQICRDRIWRCEKIENLDCLGFTLYNTMCWGPLKNFCGLNDRACVEMVSKQYKLNGPPYIILQSLK